MGMCFQELAHNLRMTKVVDKWDVPGQGRRADQSQEEEPGGDLCKKKECKNGQG